MRLHCCDCALESARLALARREAFAPLNGLGEPSPPPPVLPDPDAAAALREEARKELDVARKPIAELATIAAMRSLPSSTRSSPASAASPTCRRASEARCRHRLEALFRSAGARDLANPQFRSRRAAIPQS
jgi:hypothetical protein